MGDRTRSDERGIPAPGEAAVKLGVIALDYDGTIAEHGRLHPAVRAAIANARTRDIAVVLASGAMLSFGNVASGTLLPLRTQRVMATGTTAAGIVGLV